jgi:hypothetical protein
MPVRFTAGNLKLTERDNARYIFPCATKPHPHVRTIHVRLATPADANIIGSHRARMFRGRTLSKSLMSTQSACLIKPKPRNRLPLHKFTESYSAF